MDAHGDARQGGVHLVGLGQGLAKVAADAPEDVDLAAPGRVDHGSGIEPLAHGRPKAPELFERIGVLVVDRRARPDRPLRRHPSRRRPAPPSGRGSASARSPVGRRSPWTRRGCTTAATVSVPWACCVSPMLQTKTPVFARRGCRRRRARPPCARRRDAPARRGRTPSRCAWYSSPVLHVWASMNAWSTPPRSIRSFCTA